jgi:hypothetical protein
MEEQKHEGYSVWQSKGTPHDPTRCLKLEPRLTQNEILGEGWQFMSLCGSLVQFYKEFSGSSWRQLDWDEKDRWIVIKRVGKNGSDIRVRYDGPCKDINTLRLIGNLLNY